MKKHEVIRLDIRRDYPAPPLESVTIPDGVWRNGLLVRMPNHLGDAVMALPALTMLRKRIPEHCSLQILAPEYQRPLYERLSMVDGFTGLRKLHPNTHLYTADHLVDGFPGRCFEVKGVTGFGKRALRDLCRSVEERANLTVRNFPGTVRSGRRLRWEMASGIWRQRCGRGSSIPFIPVSDGQRSGRRWRREFC